MENVHSHIYYNATTKNIYNKFIIICMPRPRVDRDLSSNKSFHSQKTKLDKN